jgi:hypothetical protein
MITKGLLYSSQRLVTPAGTTTPVANTLSQDESRYGNHGLESSVSYTRLPSGLWEHNLGVSSVSLGTDSDFNFTDQAFTIMCWAKITDYTNSNSFFCRGLNLTDGYVFYTQNNGAIYLETYQAAGRQINSSPVGSLLSNIWYFVATTRYGVTGKLYKGGLDVTSVSVNIINPLTSTRQGYWGKYETGSSYLIGQLSLMRIFNRALSASEIYSTYQSERSLFGV